MIAKPNLICLWVVLLFFNLCESYGYTLSGPTTVCRGSTASYSVDYYGCTPLNWGAGGDIHLTSYPYAINVTWNSVGSQTVTVDSDWLAVQGCNDYVSLSINVTVLDIPPVPTLSKNSSNSELCSGESWELTCDLAGYPSNYGYDWYAAGGVLINGLSSSSTNPIHTTNNSVTITPGSDNGSCFIYGRLSNGNGCPSNYTGLSFAVGPPVADISTLIYPRGQRGVNPVTLNPSSTYGFQCDYVAGASSFSWVLPSGFSFYSGSTTSTPWINTPSTTGSYTMYCSAINRCGTNWTHSLGINIGSGGGGCCPQSPINVYPNPASSELTIQVTDSLSGDSHRNLKEPIDLKIIDRFSRIVFSGQTFEKILEIPIGNLPSDIYYLNLRFKDLWIQRQVVIKHQ